MKTASACFVIGQDKLRHNLLPERVTSTSGYTLRRPPTWR
jgi:hypothetical protein